MGGLSGAFIPVSEDIGMIEAAACGALTLEKLEAMTCVCSVGLDMIAIPGDTRASTISAIIADEAAIGMVNNKTTAVRVIPAPLARRWATSVEFGGLLGWAPVMPGAFGVRPTAISSRAAAASPRLSTACATNKIFSNKYDLRRAEFGSAAEVVLCVTYKA